MVAEVLDGDPLVRLDLVGEIGLVTRPGPGNNEAEKDLVECRQASQRCAIGAAVDGAQLEDLPIHLKTQMPDLRLLDVLQ